MNNSIVNQNFDEEYALYNLKGATVSGCTFAGSADGESALKKAGNITAFPLNIPMWRPPSTAMWISSRIPAPARSPWAASAKF